MLLVKILKRKDAAAILVAIILGWIIVQPLSQTTMILAGKIARNTNTPYGPGGWKDQYLFPVVWGLLQIILLEILAWIYVLATSSMKKK